MSAKEYVGYPQLAVGGIVIKDDKVLLVRRGQAPSEGLWAIPGGKVELGETLQEACEREVLEETGLRIQAREPIYTFDVIEKDTQGKFRFHYVIIDLMADYVSGEPNPLDDAVEARWVSAPELPHLPVSHKTLELLKHPLGFCP